MFRNLVESLCRSSKMFQFSQYSSLTFFLFFAIFIVNAYVECYSNATDLQTEVKDNHGNELQENSNSTKQSPGRSLAMDLINAEKLKPRRNHPLFTNGWRAISIPKPRPQSAIISHKSVGQVVTTATVKPSLSPTMESYSRPIDNRSKFDDEIYSMKCNDDGKLYSNGEIIVSETNDPCIYCRCFYGKKICQEQKCPPPPFTDCVAEPKSNNQCCTQYICQNKIENSPTKATMEDNIADTTEPIIGEIFADKSLNPTPFRRGPQYMRESSPVLPSGIKESDHSHSKEPIDEPEMMPKADSHRRVSLLFNPMELIYNNNPIPNRIHFPGVSSKPKILPKPPIIKNALTSSTIQSHIFEPPVQVDSDLGNTSKPTAINQSPIRALPQSPVHDNQKVRDSNQSIESTIRVSQATTTTTTKNPSISTTPIAIQAPQSIDLKDIFQISGCNIYGKMYKKDETIEELSGKCKACVCASSGIKCVQNC